MDLKFCLLASSWGKSTNAATANRSLRQKIVLQGMLLTFTSGLQLTLSFPGAVSIQRKSEGWIKHSEAFLLQQGQCAHGGAAPRLQNLQEWGTGRQRRLCQKLLKGWSTATSRV